MNNTADQHEQIEAYLNGELTADKQQAMETRIAKDPSFRQEVQLHRELAATFGDPTYEQLESILTERRNTVAKTNLSPIRWVGNWGLAAAILLLISACLLYLFSAPAAINNDEIFADYFQVYESDNFRDATSTDGRTLTAPEVQFYQAQSLLERGDATAALSILTPLKAGSSLPGLQQPIEWYIALSQLKTNDLAAARQSLENIVVQENHYKAGEAQEILEKID